MGVGFEEIMAEENQDNEEELRVVERSIEPISTGSDFEQDVYRFVNGLGSFLSKQFELLVYGLIIVSVAVGAWQTVEGHEDDFRQVEVFAVAVFTLEYLLRLIGARADPNFGQLGPISSRLRFMVSFYAIVDVLAIVPYYLAAALPNSIVNDYDEYLRMLRILRLLKLDKYIPSITLIGKLSDSVHCFDSTVLTVRIPLDRRRDSPQVQLSASGFLRSRHAVDLVLGSIVCHRVQGQRRSHRPGPIVRLLRELYYDKPIQQHF